MARMGGVAGSHTQLGFRASFLAAVLHSSTSHCCAVLYCAVLCSAVPCCAVLCCAALRSPRGGVVALLHGLHALERLEVRDQAGAVRAQRAEEDGLAAALEQQQLVEFLRAGGRGWEMGWGWGGVGAGRAGCACCKGGER